MFALKFKKALSKVPVLHQMHTICRLFKLLNEVGLREEVPNSKRTESPKS